MCCFAAGKMSQTKIHIHTPRSLFQKQEWAQHGTPQNKTRTTQANGAANGQHSRDAL